MSIQALKQFAQENGLQYDAARRCAYGGFSGYRITASAYGAKEYLLSFGVNGSDSASVQALSEHLQKLRQENPNVIMANTYENAVNIGLKAGKSDAQTIASLFRDVTAFCQAQNMRAVCPNCGMETSVSPAGVNGQVRFVCESCFGQMSQNVEPKETKPQGIALGILGALIGCLLGGALWVLIYKLGYIAGIAGLAMLLLAVKGYTLFAKELNAPALLLCVILSLLMIFIAENVSVFWDFYSELKSYYPVISLSDINVFEAIKMFWEEEEIRFPMIKDLAFGYFFYVIAGITYIRQLFQTTKKRNELVRLA